MEGTVTRNPLKGFVGTCMIILFPGGGDGMWPMPMWTMYMG